MATINFSSVFILLLQITILIIFFLRRKKKTLNFPPGSSGWPIVGETLDFLRANREGKPEKFVEDRIEKYKSKIFKTSIMGENVVVIGGAGGNKFLFSNENKKVNVWWPVTIRKLLGPCLITSVGEEAKLMRKMLSYFISPDAFSRLYTKTMEVVALDHVDKYWEGNTSVTYFLFTFTYHVLTFYVFKK